MDIVFAYVDPGCASMLLQALVGGSAGLIVFVRYLWQRITLVSDEGQAVHETVEQ